MLPRQTSECLYALLLLALVGLPGELAAERPRELRPGVPTVRTLAAGEAQVFIAELDAGPWLVRVEQRGIDVVLSAWDPGDGPVAAVDSPLDRLGDELLLVSAPASGPYRLEVRSREAEAPDGSYEILVEALADADETRLTALADVTEAGRHYLAGGADGWRAAADAYRRAFAAWHRLGDAHSLGDRRGEARALYSSAVLLRLLDERSEAIGLGELVLPLWRELGDDVWQASTLNELGLNHLFLGRPGEARGFFEQALALHRARAATAEEVVALTNVCVTYQAERRLRDALSCHERARVLFRQVEEPERESAALTSLGRLYYDLGEPLEALDRYRAALVGLQRTGNRRAQGITLDNIGSVHRTLGELSDALAVYGQALAIFEELEDRRWQSRSLHNLGVVYCDLGEPVRGLPYLHRALDLRRALGDLRGQATTLSDLALCADDGPRAAVEGQLEALALLRGQAKVATQEAGLRVVLGRHLIDLQRFAEARTHLDRALELLGGADDLRAEATAWQELGRLELAEGRLGEARDDVRRALELRRSIHLVSKEIQSLVLLSEIERRIGDPESAWSHTGEAIDLVEGVRAEVLSPQLRAAFLGSRRRAYELRIDLELERGRIGAALEVSERARARTLLDVLDRDALGEIDPALARRWRSLQQRLAAKASRRVELLSRRDVDETLELEIAEILTELEATEAAARRDHPRYDALAAPPTVDPARLAELLGGDTALVEVALGDERSHLWVATDDGLTHHELPARSRLEDLARRAHEDLRIYRPQAGAEGQRAAAELSRLLLAPAAAQIGDRRLAVVADGALHYVPFGALPSLSDDSSPVLAFREVVHLPSASVLWAQRRSPPRPSPISEKTRLVVLADPVFDPSDERLQRRADAPAVPPMDVVLDRLPASRREAEAIAGLLPPDDVRLLLDFAANRDTVIAGELRDARYLHFATHGVLDTRDPALSALVLSRVDETGWRREGALRLHDIVALRLDAELVVLSGCETALGREIRGEGLVGLTRGFMYAGVPRVIASLWRVQDRSTARLMEELYRALLLDGLRPAAALRRAQLAIRQDRRWRDPYFWAPFLLQGDWR